MAQMIHSWISKLFIALIPVLLAALVTIAWQNSHTLTVLTHRIERNERETQHLRELIEEELKQGVKQ